MQLEPQEEHPLVFEEPEQDELQLLHPLDVDEPEHVLSHQESQPNAQ